MSKIYYDLGTTGFNAGRQRNVEIVSIGAITETGATFHQHLIPHEDISQDATEIHGITKIDGEIYKNGCYISYAVDPEIGLQWFFDWLAFRNVRYLVSFDHKQDRKLLSFNDREHDCAS